MKANNTSKTPYTSQRLKDYALWYYFRYYPSNNKLLSKLNEKGTKDDAIQVYNELKHLFQEDEIIASKIDNYIYRNKNYRYITQKMREKMFPIEKTEKYLEKYKETWESILDEEFLRRKIQNYKWKGKSKQYIIMKLSETKEDKEKLLPLIEEYFIDGEWENILKEYHKIYKKFSREKVFQKLIAKWFKYDEIKKVID